MKTKKTVCVLLVTVMFLSIFSACGQIPDTDVESTETERINAATDEFAASDTSTEPTESQTVLETTPITEEVPDTENPASDFEYTVNEDNTITITKYIGSDAHVIIPEKIEDKIVTEIGSPAFRGCRNLQSITLSSNIETIDSYAFRECESLVSINFSNNLKKIGTSVFENCKSLSSVYIPKSVTNIDTYAFANSGIKTVAFEDGIALKTISIGMFKNCPIEKITLPSSVEKISSVAFAYCSSLTSITLNEGLKEIEKWAFEACDNLTEIVLPKTVQKIEEFSFALSSIKKVKFEGNSPEITMVDGMSAQGNDFTIYYHKDAKGFTSPTWNGFKTESW